MALRFRRTIKIAPGVRLNVTKTGISTRVGPRGAGVTVGTSGTTVSAGIPGSGLHMSQKISKGRKVAKGHTASTLEVPEVKKGLGFFGWIGVLVWIAIAILAVAKIAG